MALYFRWLAIPFLMLLSPCEAWASDTTPYAPTLLDAASTQGILVERLSKAYLAIALNLEAKQTVQLSLARQQFATQLSQLEQAKFTAEGQENYALLHQLWGDYQAMISLPPSMRQGKQLAELSEELVWVSQKGYQSLLAKAPLSNRLPHAAALRIAGLSQRLAKLYLLKQGGIRTAAINKDIDAATLEIKGLLTQIKPIAPRYAGMQDQLDLIQTQWLFFDLALRAQKAATTQSERQAALDVLSTSEHVYALAHEVAATLSAQGQ